MRKLVRPLKQGLDYFPLDTEMDDKVKLIDAKFGVAGFGVLIKIWQIIYDNGYYLKWTEKELLLYKNRINADLNLINDVINECLRWEIFNNEIFERYSILTSSGIQKRYFEATKRRTDITLTQELSLVPVPQGFKSAIKLVPIEIIAGNNSKNVDSNTQSKLKRKKKESIPPIVPPLENESENNPQCESLFVEMAKGTGTPVDHSTTIEERFNRFWKAYPRKVGKGKAEEKFKKIKPSEILLQEMITAIKTQMKSRDWIKEDGEYIPNPATWLNQKRWKDSLGEDNPRPPDNPGKYDDVYL